MVGIGMTSPEMIGLGMNRPARVLHVDDDDDVRALYGGMLRGAGLDVDNVPTAWEALGAVLNENYDAVILDISMPGLSGIELCRALRGIGRLSRVPIIYLTGAADQAEVRVAAYGAGGDAILNKPVAGEELIAAVTNAIRRGGQAVGVDLALTRALAEGVAHSLGSPVFTIQAAAMDIRDQAAAGALSPDAAVAHASAIETEANAVASVIERLKSAAQASVAKPGEASDGVAASELMTLVAMLFTMRHDSLGYRVNLPNPLSPGALARIGGHNSAPLARVMLGGAEVVRSALGEDGGDITFSTDGGDGAPVELVVTARGQIGRPQADRKLLALVREAERLGGSLDVRDGPSEMAIKFRLPSAS